jgi:probable rRNA maturation factor
MPAGDQRRVRGLSVVVTDERGLPVSAGGLARWLRGIAPARARGAVGVALVSDARSRTLNRQYRGRDYATDVLSFPAEPVSDCRRPLVAQAFRPAYGRRAALKGCATLRPNPYLGDIVIARGVARRQAREVGHDEPTELRVLALHGLLHLLGYDHERDHGTMGRTERRLRRKGGLTEGLLER